MIMGGPGWITGILAAVMLTVAFYCTGRLVVAHRTGKPTEVDTDGTHAVMGVAMAGMLAAGLRFLPNGVWEAVFALGAAWFAGRSIRARRQPAAASPWRCPHPFPHLVECGAMLYMLAVVATVTGGSGMAAMALSGTASRFSVVALALALFMLGYAVWVGDRLTSLAPARLPAVAMAAVPAVFTTQAAAAPAPDQAAPPADACRPLLAPRCAALCKIAMGVTMGYMLIMVL